MFDAEHDDADYRAFSDRCQGDRHHFRFIVSPQDAEELSDLKAFTRDLMAQAQRDLGTRLDWVGLDHWNTDNPHVHVIVRGKGDDGRDLVIARDYISHGLRARAAHLATLELGPRSDLEIRRGREAQVEADRWTADFGWITAVFDLVDSKRVRFVSRKCRADGIPSAVRLADRKARNVRKFCN